MTGPGVKTIRAIGKEQSLRKTAENRLEPGIPSCSVQVPIGER